MHLCSKNQFTRLLNNTTFVVPRIVDSKLVEIVFPSSLYALNKGLPSIKKHFMCASFFSCLFHFHHTLFRGLEGTCVNPRSFSLFMHSLVCQIPHSFLTNFSQTYVSTSPMYALPVKIFSA